MRRGAHIEDAKRKKNNKITDKREEEYYYTLDTLGMTEWSFERCIHCPFVHNLKRELRSPARNCLRMVQYHWEQWWNPWTTRVTFKTIEKGEKKKKEKEREEELDQPLFLFEIDKY